MYFGEIVIVEPWSPKARLRQSAIRAMLLDAHKRSWDFFRAVCRHLKDEHNRRIAMRFVRAELERELHIAPRPPRIPLHAPHARCCSPAEAWRVRGPPLVQ